MKEKLRSAQAREKGKKIHQWAPPSGVMEDVTRRKASPDRRLFYKGKSKLREGQGTQLGNTRIGLLQHVRFRRLFKRHHFWA